MQWTTAIVAFAGAAIVLGVRPSVGLSVYLCILLLYPAYVRISIGTIDISASRIVVCALLLRCLVSPALVRQFRCKLLDTLVAVSMVVYAATLAFTTPFDIWLENRGGFVMDTFLAYLVVRLVIVDRASFMAVIKTLALITLPLAIHAATETLTGWSLYAGLGKYCPWAPIKGMYYQTRYGLNRAMGPFGNPIMFGLYFATMLPILWLLRHERPPWKSLSRPLIATLILGVAATISSGPCVTLLIVAFCLALRRAKHLVKPLLALLVIGCIGVEIISNRHFYDPVLDRLGMDPTNAWYRSQLFEVAVNKLPEYWTVGYGLGDPGWGPLIDGRNSTDAVNDYVAHAIRHGVPGLLAFVSVLVAAMHATIRIHAAAWSPWAGACAWCLGSILAGLIVAFFGVSLFGQMTNVFYVLLGMQCAISAGMDTGKLARSPALLAGPHPLNKADPHSRFCKS